MFYKKRGRDILRYLQVITFECFVTTALSERYIWAEVFCLEWKENRMHDIESDYSYRI